MYGLDQKEQERLIAGIRAAFTIPFIDDVEDFIWEALFTHVRQVPLVDPLTRTRSKQLFDVVDSERSIGWSIKALQKKIKPSCEFELVIQRANIFTKHQKLGFGKLGKESATSTLGAALLEHWHRKVQGDAKKQNVVHKRVCVLLKSEDKKRYAFYEDDLEEYAPNDLEWKWTNDNKAGLKGMRKSDGFCVYRWYPNQKQFFERFVLPTDAYIFELSPKRLPFSEIIDLLLATLNNTF